MNKINKPSSFFCFNSSIRFLHSTYGSTKAVRVKAEARTWRTKTSAKMTAIPVTIITGINSPIVSNWGFFVLNEK